MSSLKVPRGLGRFPTYGCLLKIMVPPNHPFVHRVFHYIFSPSILVGFPPIFGNIHILNVFFVGKVGGEIRILAKLTGPNWTKGGAILFVSYMEKKNINLNGAVLRYKGRFQRFTKVCSFGKTYTFVHHMSLLVESPTPCFFMDGK